VGKPVYLQDDERVSQFSLFEGDLMNRSFARIGLGNRQPHHILFRFLILVTISYGGMAVFSIKQAMSLPPNAAPALNFFLDFAAYTQYFIGLPLFLIAERIISDNILSAARDFENSGVVSDEDKPKLIQMEKRVEELRKAMWPEYFLIIMSLYMGVMALGVEMFTTNTEMVTWHSAKIDHPVFTRWMTPAGWYAMFVGLPIMSYVWLRTFWKVTLWYWYLKQISKFKLTLVASHPDKTGGIGFLSEVQSKFAIVILAFGISNILSTVGYKIAIEHAPVDLPPVWGMVVGFVVFAPIMFLAPLLLFTKQLSRTKKRAMAQFREKAMMSAVAVEENWLMNDDGSRERKEQLRDELTQLNLLTGFYERIQAMRVIPFDLRSAGQLIGSAVGPMLPLLPYFFDIPEAWIKILDMLFGWLHK
jgi:hypothetical protein